MDPSITDAVVSSIGAAAGAYGQAVLTSAENMAADGTVRLGQRLLARLRRSRNCGPQFDVSVLDVAAHPGDPDFTATLRAQIRKMLEADPDLEPDLVGIVKAAGLNIASATERGVAVQHNEGIISTGDKARNRIQKL